MPLYSLLAGEETSKQIAENKTFPTCIPILMTALNLSKLNMSYGAGIQTVHVIKVQPTY